MLTPMDLAAASAGPWLVLGVVLGVLLAGLLALAVAAVRRSKPTATASGARASDNTGTPEPDRTSGWLEDDLPGFLDQPPGTAPGATPPASDPGEDPPLAALEPPGAPPRRSFAAHAAPASSPAPAPGRLLRVLATAAV